jgi:hypothetical protein
MRENKNWSSPLRPPYFQGQEPQTHDFDDSSSAPKHLANTTTEGKRKEEKRNFPARHWVENGEKGDEIEP